MRHSIACPFGGQRAGGIEVEPLAARDANLPLHQIDVGHHLGDRVLDLQPRVHLEEIERPVLVQEKLDGAGVGVADGPGHGGGGRGDPLAQRPASPRATAIPRRLSGAGAGSNTRARRTARWCRDGRRAAGSRCAAAGSAAARDRPRCPRRLTRLPIARSRPRPTGMPARSTTRIPLPPPPATAFTMSGIARPPPRPGSTSSGDAAAGSGASLPGTTGTPAAIAAVRAAVLLPIIAIAAAEGPMNVRPAAAHAPANAAFSARKP